MSSDLDFGDEAEEGGGAEWMATFADLATLLLTFFVLLLSFANMDIMQFRMALGSVKDALGVKTEHPGSFEALSTSPVEFSDRVSSSRMQVIEEMRLLAQVKELIKSEGLDERVQASLSNRGVVIRVKGQVLFDTGEAELLADAGKTLDAINTLSKTIHAPLMIEGHTDDRPISTRRYPSNWELSAARAIAAMRYLTESKGLRPSRVGVAGYAHTRPIASNRIAQGRSKNRRVEFIFLRPEGGKPWQIGKPPADSETAHPLGEEETNQPGDADGEPEAQPEGGADGGAAAPGSEAGAPTAPGAEGHSEPPPAGVFRPIGTVISPEEIERARSR